MKESYDSYLIINMSRIIIVIYKKKNEVQGYVTFFFFLNTAGVVNTAGIS